MQIAPFINPIKWYRGAFTQKIFTAEEEKKSVDSPFAIIPLYILDTYMSWWNLIFDFGRSIGSFSLPHKRLHEFQWFRKSIESTRRCSYIQKNQISIFHSFAVEREMHLWNDCMRNWADRCHRKFSQSRRAYLTMDDLYPSKKFMLDLCKSLRHCPNTWLCGAKYHQGP